VDVFSRLLSEQNRIDFAQVKEYFRVDIFFLAFITLKFPGELIILHNKELKFFLSLSTFILYLFGHASFIRPVIDPLDLGQFLTTQLNQFFGLLIGRMDARAAVCNIHENVLGESVIFLLKGSESVEEKIVGLLFYLVEVFVLLVFGHVH
jgi:hypothetical protein